MMFDEKFTVVGEFIGGGPIDGKTVILRNIQKHASIHYEEQLSSNVIHIYAALSVDDYKFFPYKVFIRYVGCCRRDDSEIR